MIFNSWTFFVFLVVTFVAYHFMPLPPRSRGVWQVLFLTLASYIFYGWSNPWLVFLLAGSTTINAVTARHLVDKSNRHRRAWMIWAVIFNLGILIFFKYASLLVASFFPQSWWSKWGFDLSQIPLPIGISFFTFQGISLVIDLYHEKEDAKLQVPHSAGESFWFHLKIWFFKAFFPQLVAGPIVKAQQFVYQISEKRLSDVDWDSATKKLILGYFFKMVVADNLKESTALLAYPAFLDLPSLNMLFLLYGFSFQIFADFCGYSLIAMGLAELFGYRLPLNFNFPYLSRSITEFWRRWHISLSSWLREYLYFPLGGNRKGAVRTYMNLLVVMLIGGLWHGATWSYMVWGGAHGLFLAGERLFGEGKPRDESARRGPSHPAFPGILAAAQIFLTFNLVSFLWLLFKLPHFEQAVLFVKHLLHWKTGVQLPMIFSIAFFSMPIVAYHFWGAFKAFLIKRAEPAYPVALPVGFNLAYAVLLFFIITNSGSPGTFIYFQF